METIFSKVRSETRVPILSALIQYMEFWVSEIWQEKEIKRIQIEKEDKKLFLFAVDIILYLKDPKDTTKTLLDLINTFKM
jgi:hypothetical protein